MNKSLLVLMLLGITSVHAQVAPDPAASAPVAPLPVCWPKNLGGSGSAYFSYAGYLTTEPSKSGTSYGWWCLSGGVWKPVTIAAKDGFVPQLPTTSITNTLAFFKELWNLNVRQYDDPLLNGLHSAVYAEMLKAQPVAVQMYVSPFGTNTTRPLSYMTNTGLMPFKPAATVPIGTLCDCKVVAHTIGSYTYCAIGPIRIPQPLAVCSQKK